MVPDRRQEDKVGIRLVRLKRLNNEDKVVFATTWMFGQVQIAEFVEQKVINAIGLFLRELRPDIVLWSLKYFVLPEDRTIAPLLS